MSKTFLVLRWDYNQMQGESIYLTLACRAHFSLLLGNYEDLEGLDLCSFGVQLSFAAQMYTTKKNKEDMMIYGRQI